MGDVVSSIGNAIGGVVGGVEQAVGGIGSAVSAVTNGIGSVAGGLAKDVGLPDSISSAIGDFAKMAVPIGVGVLTGGIGDIGMLGDVAGFADPLSFLGGAGGGGLGGIIGGDLAPDLGGILGGITDSGFPFGNIMQGLGDMLGGGQGLIGGMLQGGPQSLIGNILGGLDPGKLLGGLTNGAGGVLQSVLQQLPQLGNLLGGGGNPLGILGNLPNLAQGFNPLDVLNGLKQGLGQVANQFPNISDALKDVLGQLGNMGGKGFDPAQLLKSVASQLGQIPELKNPMMPFNPADMLGLPGFANQFLQSMGQPKLPDSMMDQIGKAVTDAVNNAMKNFTPSQNPIQTPASAHIDPGLLQVAATLPGGAAAGGSAAGGTTGGGAAGGGGGPQTLMDAFSKNMNSMNDLQSQISNLDPSSKTYQQDLMQLQFKMQQAQTAMTAINQMMSDINQLNKQIIQAWH